MWKWMAELERGVRADWEAAGKDLEAFPGICQRRLAAVPIDVDCATFVEQLLRLDYPEQGFFNKEFGHVAITVARNVDFRVDAYLWNMGRDTSIHDHNFTGAFRPIYGISKQLSYSFEPEAERDAGLTTGVLRYCETRTIGEDDAEEIPLGERLIHLVEHFGVPTITLCVRTDDLPGRHLNEYFFPGYRLVNDRQFPLAMQKKMRLLLAMAATRQRNWRALLDTFMQSLEQCELFSLAIATNRLAAQFAASIPEDFSSAIRDFVKDRHPEWLSAAEEHKKNVEQKTSKPGGGVLDLMLAQARARSKDR